MANDLAKKQLRALLKHSDTSKHGGKVNHTDLNNVTKEQKVDSMQMP